MTRRRRDGRARLIGALILIAATPGAAGEPAPRIAPPMTEVAPPLSPTGPHRTT